MNNLIPDRGDHTPTNILAKQGVTAVGGIAGGVLLFIMRALPGVAGLIAGAVVGIVGISALRSKDPDDRKPGVIISFAGALTVLSSLTKITKFAGSLGALAGTLLHIGSAALLIMGIWNGVRFFRGLKKRS
ncbi:MAG: hypothetical protein LBQ14_00160 [Treponema sp.]|jgi:hypothetical protein|nr:hypothetical protein [Treponema sp.]